MYVNGKSEISSAATLARCTRAGSSQSCCRGWMLLQSTDDWALRLHSCRALSSQPYQEHNPGRPKSQTGARAAQLITQNCNRCAREKMSPLHRNIQAERRIQNLHQKCLCRRDSSPLHGTAPRPPRGRPQTNTGPIPGRQGPPQEALRPVNPHSSGQFQGTYATRLGAPPSCHHPAGTAVPVQGAVSHARRQRWLASILVHLAPYPPGRLLP